MRTGSQKKCSTTILNTSTGTSPVPVNSPEKTIFLHWYYVIIVPECKGRSAETGTVPAVILPLFLH